MFLSNYLSKILIGLIKIYQLSISPFLGSHCRFNPTCSQYGIDALNKHGATKGLFLLLKRLVKCHPVHKGGADPVAR